MGDVRTAADLGGRIAQPGCTRERPTVRHRPAIVPAVVPPVVVPPVVAGPAEGPMARLTAKEREVLALVAEGSSNEGIAIRLGVTARTVETHTSRIFAKLGLLADPAAHRRVQAALVHLRATATLAD